MSAEVESIAYVSNEENGRFVPWHGIGTPVDHAMTSHEALTAAELDWKVNQEKVKTVSGIEIPNTFANIRDKDNKPLGIVSNKYKICQNEDAFAFTNNLIGGDVKYETAGSLFGGKKVWLLAKLPQEEILGDKIDQYICFTNTHDGTGAVKCICTPTRVVCNNTLSLALSNAKRSWSCRHLGDMTSKLEEARHTLNLAEIYMKNLKEYAEKIVDVKVDEDAIEKMLDRLYPQSADDSDCVKRNIKAAKDDFYAAYSAVDISQFVGTAWGVIQAAADLSSHGSPNRLTKNWQENRFNRIIDGTSFTDKVVEAMQLTNV